MRRFWFLLPFLCLAFLPPAKKKITVYLIGDSTVADYEPARGPIAGWGMPFRHFFDSTVVIDNRARGGRSTRTFLAEGLWQPIAANLQEGDYVLMQFGHNDEAKEEKYKDRYTPVPDYKTNLAKFIAETRAKKANPVLITPVTRMRFNKEGKQQETHTEYTAAVFEVGRQYNVPVIDLDQMSRELLDELGPQLARQLFMQLEPGEHPAYPEGQKDNTHFNNYGARRMAQLVLKGLREQKIELADRTVNREAKKAAPFTAGITGVPDTSFSLYSDYQKNLKYHPNITPVESKPVKAVKEEKNIVYCTRENRSLRLDAFYPAKKTKAKRPAVLIIHGGGWRSGNRMQHHPLAQRLAAMGYVCFTPEYRLSTEALYPAAVHDLKTALRWLHAQAKTYQIDTTKIAVAGFSAGGQLAALLGTTINDPAFAGTGCYPEHSTAVQALVDIDGTLSFVHPESGEGDDSKRISAGTYWFGYSRAAAPELWLEASPLTHAGKYTPPTLFINSSVERMHAGREDFRKILNRYGIYSEVKSFSEAPHSFPLYHPWFEPMVASIDSFLQKVFYPAKKSTK